MNRRDQPATALDRAFEELGARFPATRRVYCATNPIAIAMRTLAAEWETAEDRALRLRAPGLLEAARTFEHESAMLMREVAR